MSTPCDASSHPGYRRIRAQIVAKLPEHQRHEAQTMLLLLLMMLAAGEDVSWFAEGLGYDHERGLLISVGTFQRVFAEEIAAIQQTTAALRAACLAQGFPARLVDRGIHAKQNLELLGDANIEVVLQELHAWFRTRRQDDDC
jgi:hypothetical protein